jgi:hypothetical protein
VLDADTGEIATKMRGLDDLYAAAEKPVGLGIAHSGMKWAAGYDLASKRRLWQVALSSFTALHAAWGADCVAISDASGPVRCFDADGPELWRWSPPSGEQVLRLAWCEPIEAFCGVLQPYETKHSPALVEFDGRGGIGSASELAAAMEYEFMPGGDRLVVATLDTREMSEGIVLDVRTGATVWQFRLAAPLVAREGRSE